MEQHYVCRGGCGGVATEPKVCESEGCPMKNQPMEQCNCEDGKHGAAMEMEDGDEG